MSQNWQRDFVLVLELDFKAPTLMVAAFVVQFVTILPLCHLIVVNVHLNNFMNFYVEI